MALQRQQSISLLLSRLKPESELLTFHDVCVTGAFDIPLETNNDHTRFFLLFSFVLLAVKLRIDFRVSVKWHRNSRLFIHMYDRDSTLL